MKNNNFEFDNIRDLTIGTVEMVSPSEIKVLLELNAPQNTAINTGLPTQFPKINGYVLIPNELGALVGQITWIGIQQSTFPKRKGFKDYDLIDLPYPLRKMNLSPLGILKKKEKNSKEYYEIERGVYTYPSIGDSVILPTKRQLQAIVENSEEGATVKIGSCPLAGNAPIKINPNKLFGRHVAVLGNTGSGKSCSVAGLIRWTLAEAHKNSVLPNNFLNARFIILDPNGEYTETFDNVSGIEIKKFAVEISERVQNQIKVPGWLWNSNEWISFSRAQPGAQRPLLLDALVGLKNNIEIENNYEFAFKNIIAGYIDFFNSYIAKSLINIKGKEYYDYKRALESLQENITYFISLNKISVDLDDINSKLGIFYNSHLNGNYFNMPSEKKLIEFNEELKTLISQIQEETHSGEINADSPIYFDINKLPNYLERLAEIRGNQLTQFASLLNLRLRSILEDIRIKDVINPSKELNISDWLKIFVQSDKNKGQLSIFDLSLIPNEIIHLVISIISRIIFEALQRFRKHNKNKLLPTVLVLEEAHTFIRRYDGSDEISPQRICCQTFERIAREGRKFGMGLMLSSQRPSELSATVLSQCNTFLLHRIVNDEDQRLVKKLVPDNLGGLLDELPILPTKKAILVGWAAPIPVLIEINNLPKNQQPASTDPNFWDVWIGKDKLEIDWENISNDWQGNVIDEHGNINDNDILEERDLPT